MINWPFSKTYRHRCKDGSVKIVHRKVDDAFPFYIPGWKGKLDGNANIPMTGQGEIKGEYETKIQGLLYNLDELNNSLMINFRGAYIAYQADPCAGYNFLLREVSKIIQEQNRLLKIRLQIDGLVSLAKTSKAKGEFLPLYRNIIEQVGGSTIPDAAKLEIKDLTNQAHKWIGDNDAM